MVFLLIRIFIGVVFLTSGFEKAVSPSANFLYVIQAYQAFPPFLEQLASVVFPWIELAVGSFVLLGLFLPLALAASSLLSFLLICLVGQAIVRALPIDSCGCFGNLVHLPLQGVLVLDIVMFAGALFLLKNIKKVKWFGLDAFYA